MTTSISIMIRASGSCDAESWAVDTYINGIMVSTAHCHSFNAEAEAHNASEEFGGEANNATLVVNGVESKHNCAPGSCAYAPPTPTPYKL